MSYEDKSHLTASQLFHKQQVIFTRSEKKDLVRWVRNSRDFWKSEPGGLALWTIPSKVNRYGVEQEQEQSHLVLLVKKASKQDKYDWAKAHNLAWHHISPELFCQKIWQVLYGDELTLAFNGFLSKVAT
jgi:hypothetical protein